MSTLSAFPFIGEQSFATPGAFNSPLSIISANIAAVNAAAGSISGVTITPPSGNTITIASDLSVLGTIAASGPVRIGLSSNLTNYLFLSDTSNARSNYVIGSQVGGTADGLNIWDDSGQTMIVSFSKQSVRFYQQVVGPVFDVGGALADTLNAATFGTATDSDETRIQAAINAASLAGLSRVYVPASMYPYSASSVSFINTVQMVREGGDWGEYDVKAYGAAGDSATDDTASVQQVLLRLPTLGGTVRFPLGNYVVNPAAIIEIPRARTTLVMDPSSSIVLAANAQLPADSYLFRVTQGADYVTLVHLVLNGNRAGQSKRLRAVVGFQVQQLRIIEPYIHDFTGAGLTVSNCPDVYIQSPIVANCGRTGVAGTAEDGMSLLGNLSYGTTYYGTGGQLFGGRISGSGLDGLVVTAPGAKVIGLTANGNGVDQTSIGAAGIFVGGGTDSSGIVVQACTCYDNSACGIDSVGVTGGTTRGWMIVDNECFANGNAGIQLDSGQYCYVEENRCYNNFQTVAAGITPSNKVAQRGGIVLASSTTLQDSYVRRNVCYDNQTPKTQHWGIQIGAANSGYTCLNLVVEDNDVRSNLSGGIGSESTSATAQFVTGGFGSFQRNTGYNPTIQLLTSKYSVPFVAELLPISLSASTVTIAGITAGRAGTQCALMLVSSATMIHSSAFSLRDGVNVTPQVGDIFTFASDGTSWWEFSRLAIGGTVATKPEVALASERSLGWYRSAASTLALSYGTLSLPSNLSFSGTPIISFANNSAVRIPDGSSPGPTFFADVGTFAIRSGTGGTGTNPGRLSSNDGTSIFPAVTFTSERSLGWYRSAASVLALSYGGIGIKAGTDASCGTATLGSNGSVNVATKYVASNDIIFLTDQTAGGTLGDIELGGIRAGSGFTILSTSITDTSVVGWMIVRPT